jgi:hypothetical protein
MYHVNSIWKLKTRYVIKNILYKNKCRWIIGTCFISRGAEREFPLTYSGNILTYFLSPFSFYSCHKLLLFQRVICSSVARFRHLHFPYVLLTTSIHPELTVIIRTLKVFSSEIRPCVALVWTDVSKEHITSICRVTRIWFLLVRSGDAAQYVRRRQPLATAPPQLCLSVTVELLLTTAWSNILLINLPIEENYARIMHFKD